MSEHNLKKILFLLLVLFGISVVVITIYLKSKEEGQKNEIPKDNTKENIVAVNLIDPATEKFVSCPTSIEDSKYLKKQNDGTYLANLTLENIDAAISEYIKCDFAAYYGGKVNYKVSAKYGKNNINFNLLTSNTMYGVSADINNNVMSSPKFYTFNNEYLVVKQSSTNTTGPAINDGIYIYDENGNNVFKLENVTLDLYDENNILKNGIKYRKICEGAWLYEDCKTITYGEIKYNPETKTFTNITEEKSAN